MASIGGPTTKRQVAVQDPRTRALEACMRVIGDQPLAKVHMAHIANAAGMSAGHILYYFGSKDRLLLDTIIWNEERMARRRRLELPQLERAVDRLSRLIEIEAPAARLDPVWLMWFYILARQTKDEELQRRIAHIEMAWVIDVSDIVQYGIARGEFASIDPEEFAVRFMAYLDGLAVNVVTGSTRITRDRMLEMAMDAAARELKFDRRG
jgi:AcrR family transcriptional regulator